MTEEGWAYFKKTINSEDLGKPGTDVNDLLEQEGLEAIALG